MQHLLHFCLQPIDLCRGLIVAHLGQGDEELPDNVDVADPGGSHLDSGVDAPREVRDRSDPHGELECALGSGEDEIHLLADILDLLQGPTNLLVVDGEVLGEELHVRFVLLLEADLHIPGDLIEGESLEVTLPLPLDERSGDGLEFLGKFLAPSNAPSPKLYGFGAHLEVFEDEPHHCDDGYYLV